MHLQLAGHEEQMAVDERGSGAALTGRDENWRSHWYGPFLRTALTATTLLQSEIGKILPCSSLMIAILMMNNGKQKTNKTHSTTNVSVSNVSDFIFVDLVQHIRTDRIISAGGRS